MPTILRASFRAAATISIAALASAQDGQLDRVGRAAHDGDSKKSSSKGFSIDLDDDDDDGGLFSFLVQLPLELPQTMLGDHGGATAFAFYPYESGGGYWDVEGPPESVERWSFQPRLERGSDFRGLERTGVGLVVEHASRLVIDTTWSRWTEDVSSGTDDLDLGDANLCYRFACNDYAAFRAGAGVNWLDDDGGSEAGFNVTYAVDFLPGSPLTAGMEVDVGTVGEASQFHFRAALGAVLGPAEGFASWDRFDFGDTELDSFNLGVRLWL